MKRPDCKNMGLVASLLLALSAAGCGGFQGSVPISPMMFMQAPSPRPAPAESDRDTLAAVNTPLPPRL